MRYPTGHLHGFVLLGQRLQELSRIDNGGVDVPLSTMHSVGSLSSLSVLLYDCVRCLERDHLLELRKLFRETFQQWCSKADKSRSFRWMSQDSIAAFGAGMLEKRLVSVSISPVITGKFNTEVVNFGCKMIDLLYQDAVWFQGESLHSQRQLTKEDVLSCVIVDPAISSQGMYYSKKRRQVEYNSNWYGAFISSCVLLYVDNVNTPGCVSIPVDVLIERILIGTVPCNEILLPISPNNIDILDTLKDLDARIAIAESELQKRRKVSSKLCSELLS